MIWRYMPPGCFLQKARHHSADVWTIRLDGPNNHIGETLTDGTNRVVMWANTLDKLARELVQQHRTAKAKATRAAKKAAYDKQETTK